MNEEGRIKLIQRKLEQIKQRWAHLKTHPGQLKKKPKERAEGKSRGGERGPERNVSQFHGDRQENEQKKTHTKNTQEDEETMRRAKT